MLDLNKLREIIRYDSSTGLFLWRVSGSGRRGIGQVAGSICKDGYRRIVIEHKSYSANRLAWFYRTGEWPKVLLDHRDADRSNDRFSNLRNATSSQNGANRRISAKNRSGFKGVTWHKKSGKWQASIKVGDKFHYLGLFVEPAAAHAAYFDAAKRFHGEFARSA